MAKSKPNVIHYHNALIRRTPYGTFRAEINHALSRLRKTHKNEADARAWVDAQQIALANAERPLTVMDHRDAQRALELLPDGVTLTDAAQAWIRSSQRIQAVPVARAVAKFIADREASGLRDKTLAQYRSQLHRFAEDHPGAITPDMTGGQLVAWLNARPMAPRTRATYRASLSAFFSWAKRIGYYGTDNPAQAITIPREDQRLPGILSVGQTRLLMRAAQVHHPELCAYLAVGLFAGVRPAELGRLEWDSINAEHIHIGPAVAKTRQQRFVTICPTLAIWLDSHRAKGPLSPVKAKTRERRLADACTAAGITSWPNNAMRHSFATYHLALYQDAPKTSHELGHSSPNMLYQHYRNLATPDQARAYFAITPESLDHLTLPNPPPEMSSNTPAKP